LESSLPPHLAWSIEALTAERLAGKTTLPLLRFWVSGVELHCHFFTTAEIEFDFDPRQVGEPQLRAVLEFMARLGDLTCKLVALTPENGREMPIFRYDPGIKRIGWIPPRKPPSS
jgi:hypothetical protein